MKRKDVQIKLQRVASQAGISMYDCTYTDVLFRFYAGRARRDTPIMQEYVLLDAYRYPMLSQRYREKEK